MLKEVVKKAKIPAKSRVIPPDVVVHYRDQIQKLATEIKSILKEEKEEKELRVSEMEVNKARNMLEHEREIYSRPPRTWIQPNARKRPAQGTLVYWVNAIMHFWRAERQRRVLSDISYQCMHTGTTCERISPI